MAVKRKSKTTKQAPGMVPERRVLLEYIADNPSRSSRREICRAFNIKGNARTELKELLQSLRADGQLDKARGGYVQAGTLPNVAVLDIVSRDRDGGLLAKPARWPPHENAAITTDAPMVSIGRPTGRGASRHKTVGVGDRVLARISRQNDKSGPAYSARVIKLLDRQQETILGVFRSRSGKNNDSGGWIEPVERRQRQLVIEADNVGNARNGDLVEVRLIGTAHRTEQQAKIITVVGTLKSELAISLIAIHANEIPHVFRDEVIAEADRAGPASMENREDWRHVPLVTIDPADARDHDDAIFARTDDNPENPGGYRVTVAIADVAWYVQAGSELGREALKRGNSVYFPGRVVPMLPERISNDLCSLKENVDRPALAVEMIFSAAGEKISHKFSRIMMRSHARLSYQQAQAAIDGTASLPEADILDTVLKPLWQAYFCLTKARNERQPLQLELPERKIILNKDGTVDRIFVPPRLDAHRLVEEFMIQANVAAAETLERRKQPLIYRVHDQPSLTKLESLRQFLKTLNLSLIKGGGLRPSHFNQILTKVEETDKQQLVNQVVLRAQSQAEYNPQNIGHFGLNLARYAHFTSPIRRYADLVVHRALIGALGLGAGGISRDEEALLGDIAVDISQTERRAMRAERDTVDRLVAAHLADRIDAKFSARINGVTKSGLFVTLDETGADGFVPLSGLGDEYYFYDEAAHAVTGEHSGLSYQLGDKVEVRLIEAAPLAGALRFEILSEGQKSTSLPRSRRTNAKRRSDPGRFSHHGKKRRGARR